MADYINRLSEIEDAVKSWLETILTNIVLIGQIPAPTFGEDLRSQVFLERLAEFQVDECTTDGYGNPIGIIRGLSREKPPIFLVAHMDTPFDNSVDHNYTIKEDTITGAGLMDNSAGVGVLVSLAEIFNSLNLKFQSDIVLAGVIQSIGKGNLRGIRHLLGTWPSPIRGAVCIEGAELGRLSYYSYGMIRGEIKCTIKTGTKRPTRFQPNAILVLNELVNKILALRLPQRPRSEIIIGTISGGLKHGTIAFKSRLGFEIKSDSDKMVKSLYRDIRDIVEELKHEYDIDLRLKTISNVDASGLTFSHPLVKVVTEIMDKLNFNPNIEPSESELSIFLSRRTPAVTLGVTHGESYQNKRSVMEIKPMIKGIAQIISTIIAIDSGVCDG